MSAPRGTAIVTGASDGIGRAAAEGLYREGFRVVVVGRTPEKTATVARELGSDSHIADFAHLDQVRTLARDLLDTNPRIDVLLNNAGGIGGSRRSATDDGFEWTFQVNHLAPFLLTNLLRERLVASQSRVIATSSDANRRGRINVADLQAEPRYSALSAYERTKLANIMFTKELATRWGPLGVTAAAVHPGMVRSRFGSTSTLPVRMVMASPIRRMMLTPEAGADTLIWLATAPTESWQSGGYYTKRQPVEPNPQALDETLTRQLWERSAELTGI